MVSDQKCGALITDRSLLHYRCSWRLRRARSASDHFGDRASSVVSGLPAEALTRLGCISQYFARPPPAAGIGVDA